MKIRGKMLKRGTIIWRDKREVFVWRGFEFAGVDTHEISAMVDGKQLFGLDECKFDLSKVAR